MGNNPKLSGIQIKMTINGNPKSEKLAPEESYPRALIFRVTENMQNANIKVFILNGSDFEFTFTDGRKRGIPFYSKNGSISHSAQRIKKKLLSEFNGKADTFINLVFGDIEDELISRRDEIFKTH